MIRHSYREMFRVALITKPNVAPSLPDDLIAQAFQDPDHLTPLYDRQLWAHTVTATLLIRVLDISGMGWCWAIMSSRQSRMASLTFSSASSIVSP